jgi:hypothetical protein
MNGEGPGKMDKQIAFTLDVEPLVFFLLILGVAGIFTILSFRITDLISRRKHRKQPRTVILNAKKDLLS